MSFRATEIKCAHLGLRYSKNKFPTGEVLIVLCVTENVFLKLVSIQTLVEFQHIPIQPWNS